MSAELKQLVNRCLNDDPAAILHLWNRFGDKVFGLCYRMLGQWQDAEDAAQETFVRVTRHLSSWDSRRAFEPWLLTIAANRCRSVLARRGRRPTWEMLLDDGPADRSSTQEQARKQLAEEVDLVLSGMRREWAEAFRLFHEEELSYDEIARRLDCPLGTVKTWVHRARGELIRQLRSRAAIER